MDGNNNWTFERSRTKLDELDSMISTKALEVSNKLMETGDFSEEIALEEGIFRAKEWFYDLEG